MMIAYERQNWLFKTKTHTVCRGWDLTLSPAGTDPTSIFLVIVPNDANEPKLITAEEAIKLWFNEGLKSEETQL